MRFKLDDRDNNTLRNSFELLHEIFHLKLIFEFVFY